MPVTISLNLWLDLRAGDDSIFIGILATSDTNVLNKGMICDMIESKVGKMWKLHENPHTNSYTTIPQVLTRFCCQTCLPIHTMAFRSASIVRTPKVLSSSSITVYHSCSCSCGTPAMAWDFSTEFLG